MWDWQKEERLADVKVCVRACCGATSSVSRMEPSSPGPGLCPRRRPRRDPFSRRPQAPALSPQSQGLAGLLLPFMASVRVSHPHSTATSLLIRSIAPSFTPSLTYLLMFFLSSTNTEVPFSHTCQSSTGGVMTSEMCPLPRWRARHGSGDQGSLSRAEWTQEGGARSWSSQWGLFLQGGPLNFPICQ